MERGEGGGGGGGATGGGIQVLKYGTGESGGTAHSLLELRSNTHSHLSRPEQVSHRVGLLTGC